MNKPQLIYNIVQKEHTSIVDISRDTSLSSNDGKYITTLLNNIQFTTQNFVNILINELKLETKIVFQKDSYSTLQRIKELFLGIHLFNETSKSNMYNSIDIHDAAIVNIDASLSVINDKVTSLINYFTNEDGYVEVSQESTVDGADGADGADSEVYTMTQEAVTYSLNELDDDTPYIININDSFTISLHNTSKESNFIKGTNMTPRAFLNKLVLDLEIEDNVSVNEETFVTTRRLKELYPALDLIDTRVESNTNNHLTDIDNSLNIIYSQINTLNAKIDSINEYKNSLTTTDDSI